MKAKHMRAIRVRSNMRILTAGAERSEQSHLFGLRVSVEYSGGSALSGRTPKLEGS